ncbi:MAG: hypothetical protein KJ887_01730 [Candidatus Omnitrophica bacterium]|nr:hypothetical protein [Candidatus Omnitrophota bacterium]MBU1047380.1 hypothetical protein [Candidatus Omnitrophota bacterium]MBU1630183.1 hypothetical protein [Candidatus Omnitrophota bacterium]MBU1889035.1 hypothetical protein [Candidatus Omnitrophota bacterium]
MKTILVHSIAGNNNRIFDPDGRDGCHDPAIYLRERLLQCGYDLKTSDNNPLKDCEWVFFYEDVSVRTYAGWYGLAKKLKAKINRRPLIRNLYEECIRAGMQKRMALFLWEPPSVCQNNWDPGLHKLFPVIFTWHDTFVDNRKIFKVCVPQMRQFPEVPKIPFMQRKLLVNISMNKYSRHSRELYSARRDAIRYFERKYPDSFDLFGIMWDKSPTLLKRYFPWMRQIYPSYRGTIKNKWDVMPNYRFSICYENIRDEPGYVTEKIFDSMRCGCVPIYWGAPNIHDYVDADAFIDRRKFKTNAELDGYLSNITESEYARFQDAIRSYLAGPRFAKFLPTAYADTIINTLKLKA